MKKISLTYQAMLILGTFAALTAPLKTASAQNAPSEDPVVLTKRIVTQMQLDGGAARSKPLDNAAIPDWMRAKVARFEAKSNSDSSTGISTDSNVTRQTSSDGVKKTCIQEVGSNTAAGGANSARNIGGNNQQIVVLKGDLVNICK